MGSSSKMVLVADNKYILRTDRDSKLRKMCAWLEGVGSKPTKTSKCSLPGSELSGGCAAAETCPIRKRGKSGVHS